MRIVVLRVVRSMRIMGRGVVVVVGVEGMDMGMVEIMGEGVVEAME